MTLVVLMKMVMMINTLFESVYSRKRRKTDDFALFKWAKTT